MSDIWKGWFYTESDSETVLLDISAEHGTYYGTGEDINAEICISEQAVSDFINLDADGQVMH